MPSHEANNIIAMISKIIGQTLTPMQQLQVEEMIINIYPGALRRWITGWYESLGKKQGKVLTFDHFYVPAMNGIIKGAMKYPKEQRFKFDIPTKKLMYAMMHAYLGTDFNMKELGDILWAINHTSKDELRMAIQVAQNSGVVNSAYVRAIIVGNRRKAAAFLRVHDERFSKVTEDPPDVLVGVPNVKSLQDAWTRRLKAAAERAEEESLGRGAAQKAKIPEHK